jgi:hypothetical protein
VNNREFAYTLVLVLACAKVYADDALDRWTQRSPPAQLNSPPTSYLYLRGITYGGGQFVTVGVRALYQYDDNGRFVDLTQMLAILTSPDGRTWTDRNPGISYPAAVDPGLKIAFGNGEYVAVGTDLIATSSDGVAWANKAPPGIGSLEDVAYGNNRFVAVGCGPENCGLILSSLDAATWTPSASGVTTDLSHIVYGNGQFVVAGEAGVILTSPDGVSWTSRGTGITNRIDQIAYGNNLFVALVETHDSSSGIYGRAILTSSDALSWSYHTFPQGIGDINYSAISYGNGQFVAAWGIYLPTYGFIYTSPDGVNWRTRGGGGGVHGITFGNNTFAAVGDDRIIQSGPIIKLSLAQNQTGGLRLLSIEAAAGFEYVIQSSTDLSAWRDYWPRMSTDASGKASLYIGADASASLFFRAVSP